MTWQVSTLVDLRKELVKALTEGEASVSEVCRRMAVSRETAYKWIARFREEGEAGLLDRSRRPHTSPRCTPAELEERVCELRRRHPAWGGRKIHHRLKALGAQGIPSPSAITDILRRNGLLAADRRQRRAYQRFEAERPNQMWQMDFKGDFALPGGRCYTLTVLDDHSRFNLCLQACPDQRRETVRSKLLPVLATYGLPETILLDNGPPWGSGYSRQPHTRFTAWLMRLGVNVSHGRPYYPQTRGKDERFHRSLGLEVLQTRPWASLEDVQLALDPWRCVYNEERPHEALAYAVPAQRYTYSPRPLPSRLPALEYLATDEVRRVQADGKISFRGRELRVGKAFIGGTVALRATEEDGVWEVYYCKQGVGRVDLCSSHVPDL
jgi:transposase InsO family protein